MKVKESDMISVFWRLMEPFLPDRHRSSSILSGRRFHPHPWPECIDDTARDVADGCGMLVR